MDGDRSGAGRDAVSIETPEGLVAGRKGNDDDVLASRGLASLVHLDLWSRHPELGPAAHTHLDDALRSRADLETLPT